MESIPCVMAHALYTMEFVPVTLVPICAKKWVYKAVECSNLEGLRMFVFTFFARLSGETGFRRFQRTNFI